MRDWRTLRRYSQLELALVAEVSTKHLSYIETGRSRPSPEMIVHLCEHLDVPLRPRNAILLAAGHAPRYVLTDYHHGLDSAVRRAVDQLIASHSDPAVAVDRDWSLITSNAAAAIFLDGVARDLLVPPINVIRLSLHPEGLAPRIQNFDDYAAHVLARVKRANSSSPAPVLEQLLTDFAYLAKRRSSDATGIFLTLDLRTDAGPIRFFSTVTTFGSPRDVALEEFALETFHPADPTSRAILEAAVRSRNPTP
ncbi:MAG: helix-turn-helix domain-containing protein [Acidimicrobiales bacterium]